MSLRVLSQISKWSDLSEPVLLINSKKQSSEVQNIVEVCQRFLDTKPVLDAIFLPSSGTTQVHADDFKIIVQSRSRFLAAAKSVNQVFGITKDHHWLLTLPTFHVAGLSILARAHLSHSVVELLPQWSTQDFMKKLLMQKKFWTSLVPAQIYDLVEQKCEAPANLVGVFVGAGDLSDELYKKAIALKWPLVLSYGMTETCAMLATSTFQLGFGKQIQWLNEQIKTSEGMMEARKLYALPHIHNLTKTSEGFLCLKSPAQLIAKIERRESHLKMTSYPLEFTSEDLVELSEEHNKITLRVLGRGQEFVKILGESVNLAQLQKQINQTLAPRVSEYENVLVALEEERQGAFLCCCLLEKYQNIIEEVKDLLKVYNQTVLPFQKVSHICLIPEIPRTELQKIKWNELKDLAWKNMKHHGTKVYF